MARRRKFSRPLGERRYRKLFVIAVEGAKTEPQYFMMFNNGQSIIRVNCLKSRDDSAPPQVLKRMKDYLKKQTLSESDEAWLVVDKDQWTDEQLAQLYQWSQSAENYGFVLSNPAFEYWLLLHFEEGHEIAGAHDCIERLRIYFPHYDKGINIRRISRQMVEDAIRRAKMRDQPPCVDWPRSVGATTVYRLVESILE